MQSRLSCEFSLFHGDHIRNIIVARSQKSCVDPWLLTESKNCPSCRRLVLFDAATMNFLQLVADHNNLMQRFVNLEAPQELLKDWQSLQQLRKRQQALRDKCAGWEVSIREQANAQT